MEFDWAKWKSFYGRLDFDDKKYKIFVIRSRLVGLEIIVSNVKGVAHKSRSKFY